jgi:DNA-binding NtrC family response regulator
MTNQLRAPVIWIADDETLIRSNLSKLLESEGYCVREAADGLAAEEAFVDPEAGVLLLDLKMPRQGGPGAAPQAPRSLGRPTRDRDYRAGRQRGGD